MGLPRFLRITVIIARHPRGCGRAGSPAGGAVALYTDLLALRSDQELFEAAASWAIEFIPGVTTSYDQLELAGHESGAELLGIFQVSILHNVVHLLTTRSPLPLETIGLGFERGRQVYFHGRVINGLDAASFKLLDTHLCGDAQGLYLIPFHNAKTQGPERFSQEPVEHFRSLGGPYLTDGKTVFVYFESMGVYAYDFNGKQAVAIKRKIGFAVRRDA